MLKKEAKKPVFAPTEKISINKLYKPKTILTDVRPARPRPPITEIKGEINWQMQKAREQVIQAQVVKQMKANGQNGGTVGHKELLETVTTSIKLFKVSDSQYKNAIAGLMDEYMKRSDEDRSRYQYIA